MPLSIPMFLADAVIQARALDTAVDAPEFWGKLAGDLDGTLQGTKARLSGKAGVELVFTSGATFRLFEKQHKPGSMNIGLSPIYIERDCGETYMAKDQQKAWTAYNFITSTLLGSGQLELVAPFDKEAAAKRLSMLRSNIIVASRHETQQDFESTVSKGVTEAIAYLGVADTGPMRFLLEMLFTLR